MKNRSSSPDTAGRNITLIGALVNLILIGLKLLAGIFGKSNALIADGVHSISDLFTDVVVLVGIWRGRKSIQNGSTLDTSASLSLVSPIWAFCKWQEVTCA